MPKFRKKPVEIEAIQLGWDTWNEICEFIPKEVFGNGTYIDENGLPTENVTDKVGLFINTLEGQMLARHGDWIIKGIKGEFYPCKDEIFKMTYESTKKPSKCADCSCGKDFCS